MKKYPKYKDSGVEWIGEIPEGWKVKRIKNIGFLYSGISGKSGSDFNNLENPNNKKYINFTNIANNRFIKSTDLGLVAISEDETQNKVKKGDLLFLMSSENFEDVGKSALLLEDLGELYLNSFCKGLRLTDENINSFFLSHLLCSNALSQLISIEGRGFTRINLRQDGVLNLPVIIPPISEQTKIVNYLNKKTAEIDALISKKEKLIELLKEERTAIINQAVTRGLDPNVKLKDSGIEWLGKIPEHWEVKKIKHVSNKIGSGVTPKGGAEVYQDSGIPLLRSQNIYFNGLKLDDVAFISEEIHNSMNGSKVHSGDVLLNITGGSIGRCYFVTDEFEEANVNQHVCIIRPNEKINTVYLYNLLASVIGQTQIEACQTGSNREGLNFEQLKNFTIPLPDIMEQQTILSSFVEKNNDVDIIISKTEQEIELLKEYKTALISEVVTGKVDVRGEVVEKNHGKLELHNQ